MIKNIISIICFFNFSFAQDLPIPDWENINYAGNNHIYNQLDIYTPKTDQKNHPVIITVYKDKKFDFIIKSPPASHFIKEAVKLKSGSKEPGRNIVAKISKKQLKDIAEKKMEDLNAHDLDEAAKIIAGSAKSMGIEVKD